MLHHMFISSQPLATDAKYNELLGHLKTPTLKKTFHGNSPYYMQSLYSSLVPLHYKSYPLFLGRKSALGTRAKG